MTFDPRNNPATYPDKNGKLSRYATATTLTRAVRLNHLAEESLARIQAALARGTDRVSFALVVRRALAAYADTLRQGGDGCVEWEREQVRLASHLPPARRQTRPHPRP